MLKAFAWIRRYSFLLVIGWMALFAIDLIDDLQNNYVHRPHGHVVLMLASDLLRFLMVIGIWIAANYDPDRKSNN